MEQTWNVNDSKLFLLPARHGYQTLHFHARAWKEARGWQKRRRCCSRTDFSNFLFTRDSRKGCCTRGHVFEIQEIDSWACVAGRDECILITRPMTPGNRVYVASVSTRHCPALFYMEKLLERSEPFVQMNMRQLYTRKGRRKVAMRLSSKWIDFSRSNAGSFERKAGGRWLVN